MSLQTVDNATVDPDVQDVSVSCKSATFTYSNDRLAPDTRYEAELNFSSIEDQNGNFLDCIASNGG